MLLSPKHIQLRNFRGVRALDWHFQDQPGFYFVQGQNLKEPTLGANGAGKSTIFVDAPYWILTGKTIMSQRPGNSIEGWGTERAETYGELTLVIGDEDYVIRRGRNPSVLTINHRTVEQHEIDKLIPLSDSALRRTLLLGQRSLMFLDLRPEEKSRLFSETLDLDIWLRATEIANEDLRKKERQLTQIETQFANISGSMNEVRSQHETAVQKEAEFARAHETRLAELKRLGTDEVQRLDALSKTFAEAQTRLKQIAQSSTSDDELRNHRAAERALRDALIRLDSEQSRVEREAAQLQRQIDAYKAAICPECNQPLLDQAHTHKRREELVIAAQAALRILEQVPTRRDELNSQIRRQ
jgi:predicted  nucleic acid-binding Zn-ribbon protein